MTAMSPAGLYVTGLYSKAIASVDMAHTKSKAVASIDAVALTNVGHRKCRPGIQSASSVHTKAKGRA